MGLFDKKYCDICGEKIGLFGNRKLEDGNMCKHCAAKLSPWFSERRNSNIAEIKEQLEYREQNREEVANFNATYEIGEYIKVLVDEDAGTFMVTDEYDDLEEANPDVISLDQVTECNLNVDETESELYEVDDDGNDVPYDPPRYEYSYKFEMQIVLDHPFLDEISFQLNEDPLEIEYTDRSLFGTGEFDPERDSEYRNYLDMADEIISILTGEDEEDEDDEEEEIYEDEDGNEVEVVTCPWCGAKTVRDYTNRCENCGGDLNA